jgi:hypothetical protein
MTLGMSISVFTAVHVVISLLGIISGVVVVIGLLRSQCLEGWTGVFLASTVATSVTGLMFPFQRLLPSHVVSGISLVVLTAVILALTVYRLDGTWRWIYVVGAMLALYLNVFVGVVQAFQKVSFLQPLAPTQSEAPFLVAQIAALGLFLWLGYLAINQFRPRMPAA